MSFTSPEPDHFTETDLAARIQLIGPDVTHLLADEASGAPRGAWGDWFFYAAGDQQRPFATIVSHDVPGFDEESDLGRPGVFRLNIGIGRAEFEREFGFWPKDLADHRARFDFAAADTLFPHPAYGGQGWASMLNPTAGQWAGLERLLVPAYQQVLTRQRRRATRDDERA
jgi:hypothetical protein